MIDSGDYFAYAFYSEKLNGEQPASTFPFSKCHWSAAADEMLGRSGIINILWKGRNAEAAEEAVKAEYPDAIFKGVFTDRNFLLMPGTEPYPGVGAPINLDAYEDGPIRRVERPKMLRLIANNPALQPRRTA